MSNLSLIQHLFDIGKALTEILGCLLVKETVHCALWLYLRGLHNAPPYGQLCKSEHEAASSPRIDLQSVTDTHRPSQALFPVRSVNCVIRFITFIQALRLLYMSCHQTLLSSSTPFLGLPDCVQATIFVANTPNTSISAALVTLPSVAAMTFFTADPNM